MCGVGGALSVAPMIHETTSTLSPYTSLAEQARLVRDGEVTSRELVETSLECIARLDPRLNAFRCVMADSARAAAETAGKRGPLFGVPVAVKDNMDVAGELTTHGTGAMMRVAREDAEVVKRLRAAGAVIVGKTNLPELALWGHFTASKTHGVTHNPWNVERSAGGSSGGAAAAVASGMVAAAVGSDGGGSIRLPSAMCGVFGLKPQRGRVPLTPDEGHWHGLTHFGPIARSAADGALLLDAIGHGGPFHDAASTDPARLRVGLALNPTMPNVRLSKPVRQSMARTAERLRELGHDVMEVKPRYGMLLPAIMPRYLAGVADDADRLDLPDALEKRTRRMAAAGRRLHGRALRRALEREPEIARRINSVFEDVDLLITPMVAQAPGKADASAAHGAFRTFNDSPPYVAYSAVWNYTGQPAAAVPAGFDHDGMPLSVQIIARPHDERTLLALAAQLERATGGAERRPAVS
ncbi:MAG: amidase [Thermoleophilaceae bacterium]|nr:amidase [Thermoleophilaceae bacterium]